MMPNSTESRAADARTAHRASIYLAAALYCDGSRSPVKIRNISDTGALIEGSLIPSVGSLVQLVRGELIVHALVAWASEGRCGLKFSGCVDAQKWRAVPTNGDQQRVDDIVRLVKAGAVPLPVPQLAQLSEPSCSETDQTAVICGDLNRVVALLANLGEALASDSDIVSRHGSRLQNLDIAMQVIAGVEATISGHDDPGSDAVKLAGLRRSADQALKQTA